MKILIFVTLAGFDQGRADAGAFDQRRAERNLGALANHQHLAEGDIGARLTIELFNHEKVARLNPVLLSAGLDHSVHVSNFQVVATNGENENAREQTRGRGRLSRSGPAGVSR